MAQFYHTIPNPDDLIVCPYDNVHLVACKRLPYHLMKCRKNHPTKRMAVCSFNAKHELPEEEMRYHMTICPDRALVERQMLFNTSCDSGNSWMKGNTDVPSYFPDYEPPVSEDWDSVTPVAARIGVHARDLAGIGYIKDTKGMKPAQKKQFYANLMNNDVEGNIRLMSSMNVADEAAAATSSPASSVSTPVASTSAQASAPELSIFVQPRTQNHSMRPMGRGRGLSLHPVTPGQPATEENPEKEERKLKKKLLQIDKLVQMQKDGTDLNEEERAKIALKKTLMKRLENLKASCNK